MFGPITIAESSPSDFVTLTSAHCKKAKGGRRWLRGRVFDEVLVDEQETNLTRTTGEADYSEVGAHASRVITKYLLSAWTARRST